jgi:anti-sigma-K factor RskA
MEVEQLLQQHPSLKAELAAIEATQEALLMGLAVVPRALVKEKLFSAVDAKKEAKVIAIGSTSMLWKYAVASSVMLALVTSYLAYDYRSKWIRSVVSVNELMARSQQLAEEYTIVNNRITGIERDVRILNDPAFARVIMAGTPQAPDAKAFVYWNPTTHEVYLSLQNMKTLARENQYQLWAIVDGHPVDAGVFDGNAAGLLQMKDIGNRAAAFAVTIEPKGGKPAPTLETMQVVGTVISG